MLFGTLVWPFSLIFELSENQQKGTYFLLIWIVQLPNQPNFTDYGIFLESNSFLRILFLKYSIKHYNLSTYKWYCCIFFSNVISNIFSLNLYGYKSKKYWWNLLKCWLLFQYRANFKKLKKCLGHLGVKSLMKNNLEFGIRSIIKW